LNNSGIFVINNDMTGIYNNHIEQAKEQIGRELTLEERRAMVTQEMFNQIYNGGGPESL